MFAALSIEDPEGLNAARGRNQSSMALRAVPGAQHGSESHAGRAARLGEPCYEDARAVRASYG